MVSIDTVYQKVLALTNKEQRGYITPQEFNLFADQAQKNIFEQYFYDLNQFLRVPGNSEEYSDIVSNLEEKIVIFERFGNISSNTISPAGEDVFYRLGTVFMTGSNIKIEEVQPNERAYTLRSPLLQPTLQRPTFTRNGAMRITFNPTSITNATCTYTRMPTTPSWGYVVVNGKALYDPTNRVDFELHPSEEGELVNRILTLSGITIKAQDITQAGAGMMALEQAEQKK